VAARATLAGQAQAALQRAATLVQQGRLQEADKQAQLALSDPDTRAAACSVLGAIRVQQERLEEGAELLREAVRLDPQLVGAQLNLAQVYSLQGKDAAALPLFRRVLERDASNAAARMALARAETEKGNYKASLELAKPALAAFKLSPDGVLVLAVDFLKTGDRSSAAALVADAKRLGPVSPAWSTSFAEILVKGGLVAEGIGVLEQARTADPSSHELAFALGGAYIVKGDPSRALDAYDTALVLRPGLADRAAAGGGGRRAPR
jgi:tetratricopeptide (TPR) repeat protein